MTAKNNSQPIHLLLSREELYFVLNQLQADAIPGGPHDDLADLSAEQQTLILQVAEHTLRARELVQVQDEGAVVMHHILLTMVAACAYAQSAVSLLHWWPSQTTPRRLFGHRREYHVVVHTRPEDALHRFNLLPDLDTLLDEILAVCQYDHKIEPEPVSFQLSASDFTKARALAETGQTTQVVEILQPTGIFAEAASAFAKTLAAPSGLSVLQTLTQQPDGNVSQRDVTLLQNHSHAWLILATPQPDDGTAPLQIKTTTPHEFKNLLAGWL